MTALPAPFLMLMPSMTTLLCIAFFGAAGAAVRYGVGEAARALGVQGFPAATLFVNVVGSLLLGASAAFFAGGASPELAAGVMKGFCGALTTFSTFSMDTVRFFKQGRHAAAAANIVLNAVLCFGAAYMAFSAGR